jgi:hypothetical protein
MPGNKNSGNRTGEPRKSVSRPQKTPLKCGRSFTTRYLDDRGLFDRSSLSKTDVVNKGIEAIELLVLHASNGDERAIAYLNSIGIEALDERIEPIVVLN